MYFTRKYYLPFEVLINKTVRAILLFSIGSADKILGFLKEEVDFGSKHQ